jgi:hypothetical protein
MPQSPSFTIDIDLASSGKGVVARAGCGQAPRSAQAPDWLRRQHSSKALELLAVPTRSDDLRAAAKQAARFGGLWRRLWAESLGKDGKGSTPVSVSGPLDQHNQLQLFRDGPVTALFTLVMVDTKGRGPAAPKARAKAWGLDHLAERRLGNLVGAKARATAQILFKNGRSVRRIHLA